MRVFRKAYRDIAVCRHERKKKNTETEPILRLVLPTGGGPSNNYMTLTCDVTRLLFRSQTPDIFSIKIAMFERG